MNQVIWFTGHSGSGKTTLARALQREIVPSVVLDGNEMRSSISLGAGFSRADRKEHNLRVARLAEVLARQVVVIVAVIAPMVDVRVEIDEICNPLWVYVARRVSEREGHFYEEPSDKNCLIVDMDGLSIREAVIKVACLVKVPKIYSLVIGRFQPLHEGHVGLVRSLLGEGRNVLVALRDTPIDLKNPWTLGERKAMFEQVFGGREDVKIMVVDDIEAVCYGRDPGWSIRRVELSKTVEAVSASQIRKALREGGEL